MTGNGITYDPNYKPWLQATNINAASWGSATGSTGALGWGNTGWGNTGFGFQGTSSWGNLAWGNAGWGNSASYGASSSSSSSSSKTITSEEQKQAREAAKQKVNEKRKKNNLSTVFKGLTKSEEKLITDYSVKKQEYHEHLGSSLAMGAGMGILLPNMREITHPISAAKSTFGKNSVVNTVFNDSVRKGSLWNNHAGIMQEAYAELHKAEIRHSKSKWRGFFKRGFTDDELIKLSTKLESAIATGKSDDVLKAVAELKEANNIRGGHIPRAWQTVKSWFGGAEPATTSIDDVLTKLNTAVPDKKGNMVAPITSSMNSINTMTNLTTLKGSFNASLGGKVGIFFALTSLISEFKYMKAGFEKDRKTGFKQLGQSVAKAGSSWGGYLLGETLGRWGGARLGAKIGAKLGTAFAPGIGTAIGAVAGVILGTVASWGLRKLTNKIVGDNVANELITNNEISETIKDDEKRASFISNLTAQAAKDKDIDEETAAALKKAQELYCTA